MFFCMWGRLWVRAEVKLISKLRIVTESSYTATPLTIKQSQTLSYEADGESLDLLSWKKKGQQLIKVILTLRPKNTNHLLHISLGKRIMAIFRPNFKNPKSSPPLPKSAEKYSQHIFSPWQCSWKYYMMAFFLKEFMMLSQIMEQGIKVIFLLARQSCGQAELWWFICFM